MGSSLCTIINLVICAAKISINYQFDTFYNDSSLDKNKARSSLFHFYAKQTNTNTWINGPVRNKVSDVTLLLALLLVLKILKREGTETNGACLKRHGTFNQSSNPLLLNLIE